MNCISFSMVCKINFCSEFPDIPDQAGRKTRRRRRRRTQAVAEGYAFHGNATSVFLSTPTRPAQRLQEVLLKLAAPENFSTPNPKYKPDRLEDIDI